MNNLLVRTNGNADPKGKPRVYFTCHPDDFDAYFDTVCEELFAAYDCAIYYREDMSERGEYDRSLELFEKAYRQRLATLGSEHSETMRSLNNLSVISFNSGRNEQAVKWADILCTSGDTAIHEFIDNICTIYRYCGEDEKAKVLEARKGVLE